MKTASPKILLCADQGTLVNDLRHVLEQGGYQVGWQPLEAHEPDDLASYQMIVLEGSQSPGASLKRCRRIRSDLGESFVPILFVTEDTAPSTRLASFEGGADTYLLR